MRILDVVVFEDSGEERTLIGFCNNCRKTDEGEKDDHYGPISVYGISHIGADYGMTACGKDATGPHWWWPL